MATLSVLVVDDQATTRDLLVLLLEMGGFEVTVARNGEEALNLLENLDPDVVVTDIHMPGMGGRGLATEVQARRHTGRPRVVAVSADLDMVERLQGDERFFSVLPKPVDATNLIATATQAAQRAV